MATKTLRPNGVGDETSIPAYYPVGSHWQSVDDVSPDDSSSWVYANSVYARDLYQIENLPSGSGIINSVKIYFRIRSEDEGITAYAKPSQKSGSTVTDGTEVSITTEAYSTFSQTYLVNPATGNPYTWSEIDSLQVGVSLCGTGLTRSYCTQVYVEVDLSLEYTLAVTTGMSAAISRGMTMSRSLSVTTGMVASVRGEKDLGDWLVIGSRDSGSIKTKDGVTWSVCAKTADAGREILPASWLAQFLNRLCTLNYQDAGFAYSEVNALNPNWTDKQFLPNLAQDFNGLFEGRDASDNPTLYFLTSRGMYYLDVFSNFVFGPTEAAWEEDTNSGKKGLYWRGSNYVAAGKGIFQIRGGDALPIGPDMDDGLPEELQGTITEMIGVGFWLVIAIDGGASKKSCILKRYITGNHWQPVYVGSVNTSISALCWDGDTLYFGEGTNVKSIPMPNVMANAKYLTGDRIAEGDLIYPRFHSEFEAMPKIAHKVRATTRDCDADEKITIYYRIDEATAWTELGEFATSPRPTALPFPVSGDSVGVTFESIQIKAHYERGATTTNSPKIESLTLEYRVVPPTLWGFDFDVLAITRDDTDGQTIINALRTAMETGTLLAFYPTGSKDDTKYLVEFTAMPSAEKGTEFGQEGLFHVSVQEVID